jgi:hypothetical protein
MFRLVLQLLTSAIKVTSRSQHCLFSVALLSITFSNQDFILQCADKCVSNVIMYKGGAQHGLSVTAITTDGKYQ